MMAKQKTQQNKTEAEILATKNEDIEQAYLDLYNLYVEDIYLFCYSGVCYHTHLAEYITYYVFDKAFKYFHAFNVGEVTYRSYLLSLASTQIKRERSQLEVEQKRIPPNITKKLSQADLHLWKALQKLDIRSVMMLELFHGFGCTVNEVSMALHIDTNRINRMYSESILKFQHQIPNIQDQLNQLFANRKKVVSFSKFKKKKILQAIINRKQLSPTFVRKTIWDIIIGPIPISFAIGIIAVVGTMLWYVNRPAPIIVEDNDTTPALILEPVIKRRPQEIMTQGELPDIQVSKRSLAEVTGVLYGTNYETNEDITTSEDEELKPKIKVNLPVNEYRHVPEAYVYSIPEALDEDELQLAAFTHFSSLPLNQFTYVNGTYYIEDSDFDFRPLFIAFNEDGSVEYQMRQAAICDLEDLTKELTDDEARTLAFDFLRSHQFITVDENELLITKISEDNRTINKGAFCKNDDSAIVQDREFVFYLPHTVLSYADNTNETLPMRLQGIVVQMHGSEVTNFRVDKLNSLKQQIVKSSLLDLLTLESAIEQLEQFYYPASGDRAEHQRYARTFIQTDYLYGDQRLDEITINKVSLEYVFDELNHQIEPYYVFSGRGNDLTDKESSIRIYVAATIEEIELRGPYRE